MALYFKSISIADAAKLIANYHYSKPTNGDHCFGILKDDELVAAAIFINSRSGQNNIGELVSMARNDIHSGFHMSQLISRAAKTLKEHYDILVTYCDSDKGIGTTFQGASWCYHGKIKGGDYRLQPEPIYDASRGFHFYWRALTAAGYNRARQYGLKSLRYPRGKPKFIQPDKEHQPNAG